MAALAGTIAKVGPGTLTIGAAGTSVELSTRVKKAIVKWNKKADDGETMLSGDVVAGDTNYTAQLTATVKQGDLTTAGLVAWSWANMGKQFPFTYNPYSTTTGRQVAGILTVDPIDVGGEVGEKPDSDISWDCVGIPTLVDDLA